HIPQSFAQRKATSRTARGPSAEIRAMEAAGTPRLPAARLPGEGQLETDRAELQRVPALPHLASAPDAHHRYHERRQRYAAIYLYRWIDVVSRDSSDHEHGRPAPAGLSAWLERTTA